MSKINWITPVGSIGKIAEEEYFEFQLDAYDSSGSQLTYQVIAGRLGDGLQLFKSGLIQGIPVIETISATEDSFLQTFTIRVTNTRGQISDRTFSITINAIALPQIIPKNVSLGTYYDGYNLQIQLVATDPNPLATLQWTLINGELPRGVELTKSGKLSGYITPYTTPAAEAILGWSMTGWDYIPWSIPTAAATTKVYRFTVEVFDGSRRDQSIYTVHVQAKSLFTVDSTEFQVDGDIFTADVDNHHTPYIITQPGDIPDQRQLSNFAYQFVGKDLDGAELRYQLVLNGEVTFDQSPVPGNPYVDTVGFDELGFSQSDHSLPPGLTLAPVTGWLTGFLGSQTEEFKTYTFSIFCYKLDDPSFSSDRVTFTLTVLGDLYNVIDWITPSNLGLIDNGSISQLTISAVSSKGKKLNYRIKESIRDPDSIIPSMTYEEAIVDATAWGYTGHVKYTTQTKNQLPQGLQLLPDGLIVGRCTFEYFKLDSGTTTIDKNSVHFDTTYTFTITASDDTDPTVFSNSTVSDDKTFTVKIKNFNSTPYENIYLKALPSRDQRSKFFELINDNEIFPEQLIYRPHDPWFGKAKDIKFLFAAGLAPNTAATYVESMANNHYNKMVMLGAVKTAVALDPNFNIMYEVIYVDVLETTHTKQNPINRTSQVKPPYNVMPFTSVYPNSYAHMKDEVVQVGYANRGALPDWMLDQQEDGRILGFTQGVILAYTIPGASKLMAYRINQHKIEFNKLNFTIDRYQLDHTLTKNYNIEQKEFIESKEATFDRLPPSTDLYPYAGSVDVAVTIPFDEINGRTLEYIVRSGGFDGKTVIKSGQRLIFARQEQYTQTVTNDLAYVKDPFDANIFDSTGFNAAVVPRQYTSLNDGWNRENGLYGSFAYGVDSYAPSTIITGYTDHQVSSLVNQRGGIWEISISADSVVTLNFIKEVEINQYVFVAGGQSYGDSKLYYDPIVKPGYTVPQYSVLTSELNTSYNTTRFDGNATRFYNNKDLFAAPESGDVYLKFPKYNIYG